MKVDYIKLSVAILINLLIAFLFYEFHLGTNPFIIAISSFILLSITLSFSFSIDFEKSSVTTNIRTLSFIFYLIFLILNFIFLFFDFSILIYTVFNGLLLLIYILVSYSIQQSNN